MEFVKLLFFNCMLIVAEITSNHMVGSTEISISPEKDVLYATEKSNVSILCVATDLKGKTVRWDHNGRQIANVAPPTTVFSDPADRSKYLIKGADPEGGNFSFIILNYNNADAGVVTCDVAGVEPVNIRLETFVEPELIYMTVSTTYEEVDWDDGTTGIGLDIEASPSVSCSVINSQPAATIIWLWNDNQTLTNLLNITEITETNGKLHNLSSTITLTTDLLQHSNTSDEIIEDMDEINNMTIIEVSDSSFVNDSIDDSTIHLETLRPIIDETTKQVETRGELSCQITVGDQVYIQSLLVDFTEVNSGISTSMAVENILLIVPVLLLMKNLK